MYHGLAVTLLDGPREADRNRARAALKRLRAAELQCQSLSQFDGRPQRRHQGRHVPPRQGPRIQGGVPARYRRVSPTARREADRRRVRRTARDPDQPDQPVVRGHDAGARSALRALQGPTQRRTGGCARALRREERAPLTLPGGPGMAQVAADDPAPCQGDGFDRRREAVSRPREWCSRRAAASERGSGPTVLRFRRGGVGMPQRSGRRRIGPRQDGQELPLRTAAEACEPFDQGDQEPGHVRSGEEDGGVAARRRAAAARLLPRPAGRR